MVEDKKVEDSELESVDQKPEVAEVKSDAAKEKTSGETKAKVQPESGKEAGPKSGGADERASAEPAGTTEENDEDAPQQRVSSRSRYGAISGIVHVMATFNNTKVTITDRKGNVIAWRTAGRCGFKGSRKSTAYAATIVAQEAAREATSKGLREADVRLNGPGAGRESAVRAIHAARIKVTAIQDVTPIPHNGCRPPKRRRV